MIWALIEMVVHTKKIHLATQQHWKAVRKSSSSRKRTFGKYNKQSLSLDEKLEILDENKIKKKMNYKIMVDEFILSKI